MEKDRFLTEAADFRSRGSHILLGYFCSENHRLQLIAGKFVIATVQEDQLSLLIFYNYFFVKAT